MKKIRNQHSSILRGLGHVVTVAIVSLLKINWEGFMECSYEDLSPYSIN